MTGRGLGGIEPIIVVASFQQSRGRSALTQASAAQIHDLYERAVQDPSGEVRFVSNKFKSLRGRHAVTLREDFGGTGIFSLAWARSRRDRVAHSVDLDDETQAWGAAHRVGKAPAQVRERVRFERANVLDGVGGPVDVVVAFNFSYWIFKTRAELRHYFEVVHSSLGPEGVLFLDAFGGLDVPQIDENRVEHEDFTYVWRQRDYDVLSNDFECAISFEFDDGSEIDPAFTYSWRLWSLVEIRELLEEAGFSKVNLFWERNDADGEGTGRFYLPKRAENDHVWWTYIAAER